MGFRNRMRICPSGNEQRKRKSAFVKESKKGLSISWNKKIKLLKISLLLDVESELFEVSSFYSVTFQKQEYLRAVGSCGLCSLFWKFLLITGDENLG